MPYLSESYQIDFSQSGLYGHSLGGVFTHYAVCNSDLFENQPVSVLYIGSPLSGRRISCRMRITHLPINQSMVTLTGMIR